MSSSCHKQKSLCASEGKTSLLAQLALKGHTVALGSAYIKQEVQIFPLWGTVTDTQLASLPRSVSKIRPHRPGPFPGYLASFVLVSFPSFVILVHLYPPTRTLQPVTISWIRCLDSYFLIQLTVSFLPALALLFCRLNIITHFSLPNKLDQHHFRVLKIVDSNPFPLPPQSGGSRIRLNTCVSHEWVPHLCHNETHSIWLGKRVEEPHFLWLGWRLWSQKCLLEKLWSAGATWKLLDVERSSEGTRKKIGEKKARLITRVLIIWVQYSGTGCQFLCSATHFIMSYGKELWIPASESLGHFMSLHTSVSLL